MSDIKVGTKVTVCDGSEAHGDIGTVLWVQDNGTYLVELDDGCMWPAAVHELTIISGGEG